MCMQGVAGWPPEKRVGMRVMMGGGGGGCFFQNLRGHNVCLLMHVSARTQQV